MRRLSAIALVLAAAASAYAGDLFTIEPFAGVFTAVFSSNPDPDPVAPLVGCGVRLNFTDSFGIGIKAAGATDFVGVYPLFALVIRAGFRNGIGLNLDIGVLPGIGLTVRRHHINLGVFPFYMISGGCTTVTLTYGYEF